MDPATILGRDALSLAAAVRSGELRARAVTETYLDRITALDPALHAFLRVLGDRALARADQLDADRAAGRPLGPLAGVPVGLKDIFVTEGVETTCGSKILTGWVPPYQGWHAARLEQADAIVVGKLAMDEFAMGSSNENTPHEPVRNPWALDHVPGGSSGGSAAATAARLCRIALGSDTGGSIRQPASLCGVVGLKPTWGRVSRAGMIAFASSLDQAGPLAPTVAEVALALGVLAGRDARDATSLPDPVPDYLAACAQPIAGLRIGVHRAALELEGLAPEVARCFDDALRRLAELGAVLVDVELPHFPHATAVYYVLCTAECSSNLARYDGIRYGQRVEESTLSGMYEATRAAGFGPEVVRRIMLGTFVLRATNYEQYYGRAMRVRTLIARDYQAAFQRCDLIASPTSPVPGFRLGERTRDPLAMYLSDVFTIGANLAGLPAISVPAGLSPGPVALPIGLHLTGPRLAEPSLLAAAASFERTGAFPSVLPAHAPLPSPGAAA